jgi:hypothetical protein
MVNEPSRVFVDLGLIGKDGQGTTLSRWRGRGSPRTGASNTPAEYSAPHSDAILAVTKAPSSDAIDFVVGMTSVTRAKSGEIGVVPVATTTTTCPVTGANKRQRRRLCIFL